MKVLLSKRELDGALVNVTVTDGNVRLWGVVENADEVAAGRKRSKGNARGEVGRKQSPSRADVGRASIERFAGLRSMPRSN